MNTSFANVYRCIKCKLNLTATATQKLLESDYTKFTLDAMDKRFGKFYICNPCYENKIPRQDQPPNEFILTVTTTDNFEVYSFNHYQDQDNGGNGDNTYENDEGIIDDHEETQLEDEDMSVNPSLMLDYLIQNLPGSHQDNISPPVNDGYSYPENNAGPNDTQLSLRSSPNLSLSRLDGPGLQLEYDNNMNTFKMLDGLESSYTLNCCVCLYVFLSCYVLITYFIPLPAQGAKQSNDLDINI